MGVRARGPARRCVDSAVVTDAVISQAVRVHALTCREPVADGATISLSYDATSADGTVAHSFTEVVELPASLEGTDDAVRLTTPVTMSLEEAIAYIDNDELVEVTPNAIRLRKRHLDPHERKRHARAAS